jgi:16S rRNA (guanine527-N7)-methyltransferase
MEVCQARVETLQVSRPFDTVLSRAFASVPDMIRVCRHLLAPEGRLLAMKGACPTPELESVGKTGASVAVHSITVPGLDEQRHLVEIALPQSPESPE